MADSFVTDLSGLDATTKKVIAANAESQGITAEQYLASRGGVNTVTGKYGDSYVATRDLTDAEYLAAVAGKTGVARGAAINAATAAKSGQPVISGMPGSSDDPTGAKYGAAGGNNNPNDTGLNGVNGKIISAETRDAFSVLTALFSQYNLGSLAGTLQKLMEQGFTAEEASTKLKYDSGFVNGVSGERWNDAYTTRFAGNKARLSKGLNALSEAEYLLNENSYAETLKAYGLTNMLSVNRYDNEKKFANYIANDMSPKEFKDRIDLASTRVMNMDPAIMRNFQQYYPQVNKTDLVSYFLAPEETMQLLETKVTASEIGAAANQQGLSLGGTRAEEFAKMGQTYAGAQRDYSNIAEVLPTGQKLGSIYGEEGIDYTQATAEDEYIKQDAAAKLKRNRLASKERASFEGSAGAAQGAFSTSYLKKSSAAGLI
jgi:hypothetical protein